MFSCAVTSLHHASCWGYHLSCCLFVCLNHVKWYSFLLGGTFTFYASFRVNQRKPLCVKPSLCQVCRPSHCSVVVENGQMFFLSHLPDFYHDILCCVALVMSAVPMPLLQQFLKLRYRLLQGKVLGTGCVYLHWTWRFCMDQSCICFANIGRYYCESEWFTV